MLRSFFVLVVSAGLAAAHPQCLANDRPPDLEKTELIFCPAEQFGGEAFLQYGSCCYDTEEEVIEEKFLLESEGLTTECADLHKQVLCGQCHSYSNHLFERLGGDFGPWDGMTMKREFCDAYVDTCADQIVFGEYDGLSYCDHHVGGIDGEDELWSYPYTDPILPGGDLTLLFPDIDAESSFPTWQLSMRQTPDGAMWWIVGQEGQIVGVNTNAMDTAFEVLDIESNADFYQSFPEEGMFDVAFDPEWEDNSFFYVSYTTDSGTVDGEGVSLAQNRVSRFTWTDGDPIATRDSELVLLTTGIKQNYIHSAGWLGFKPSVYGQGNEWNDLYWSVGDGGPSEDPFNSGQDLTNLLGNMIRISVPSFAGAAELYQIPSGNYQDVDSSAAPEICAPGLRNPWRCSFDRLNDDLYCADVGQISIEEINIIECGKNYGWPRFEGSSCHAATENTEFYGACANADRSGYEFPIYEVCHTSYESDDPDYTNGIDICGDREIEAAAIIGGFVYRGSYFSEILYGAYVFSDHEFREVNFIKQNEDGEWVSGSIISEPADTFISFAEDMDGELYLIDRQWEIFYLPCGDLCSGTCLDQNDEQPSIEPLGCFADSASNRALTLETAPSCTTGDTYMSPLICASYCSTIAGAVYSGVEAGTDCYCGGASEDYSKNGALAEEDCSTLCESDPESTCGGIDAIEAEATGQAATGVCYRVYPACEAVMKVYEIGSSIMPMTPAPTVDPGPAPPTPVTTPAPGAVQGPDSTPAPAPLQVGDPAENYLGCFQDDRDARILPTMAPISLDSMDATYCMGLCEGFDYYGTQFGRECWCGSGTPAETYNLYGELTDAECDMECTGDATESCGGHLAASVYAFDVVDVVDPVDAVDSTEDYVGCFQDDRDVRILPTMMPISSEMNAALCKEMCDGFDYYGTQFSRECWCGSGTAAETYNLYEELTDADCDMECTGDATESCGGHLAASVYAFNP
ncbi:unnamed protein product [Scytosiphon promiscuus]